jgi:hypothetical protein
MAADKKFLSCPPCRLHMKLRDCLELVNKPDFYYRRSCLTRDPCTTP